MSSSEVPARPDPQPTFTPGRFAGRTVIVNVSSEASL
jgi:hypothetical protein